MRGLERSSPSSRLRAAAAVLALLVHGCGGGGSPGSPSAADQPPPVPSGLDFTITPMVDGGSVVEFQWVGTGAPGYRLEIGRSSGAWDVAVLEIPGPATRYTWSGVPIGTFYARVRAVQGGSAGAPSAEVVIGSIDARHMIDALLFAYGPLAVASNLGRGLMGGAWQDRMLGWQPGAGFGLVLAESLPADFVASAEKAVQQIGPATGWAVQAGVAERRPDPLAYPGSGEVTLAMVSVQEVRDQCACDSCVGCARTWYAGSFARRARIVLSPEASPPTVAHEIGHVIGLAHVISAAGVRPSFTMGMTTDGQYSPRGRLDVLDPATIRMLETVYGRGLTAGSTRRQFEAAGLVSPEGAGMTGSAASGLRPSGYVSRPDGLETVVLKPVCR